MEEHAYKFDALHPIMKVPPGTNNISIPLEVSRTRHGKPDAVIASRIVVFVTTAAFGVCSNTVLAVYPSAVFATRKPKMNPTIELGGKSGKYFVRADART